MTCRHLIDISSSQADPLQSRDVQERIDKYRALLDQMDSQPVSSTRMGGPKKEIYMSDHISPVDILAAAKPNEGMTETQVDWLYQTMDTIQDSLQQIQVSPAGEMVVRLTMPGSTPIRAF
ncbi:hypothetical protein PHYBLDRAFT_149389 [Phycomyces blakesleeanus NRRL 1555(-)]|uniref:Uncharacterized protein n=1 Tax=Phycomyces blakesleeanus (strain ATCC 8743b / DSM 1359 / FGSC 10004 / NBRC 33097 / NRRL 1555) TaxID=763407 RepID=A0A162TT77_PHYB8|nr:hypothetical protein PHYBLDRAFT_149389 [Phycomyces blakesleeanus NRRL 1555(-)]OAD69603.1 hypothetical protein PHYBLDRAFT_149389 [Phycomyces blakesleeanus NRRL 1555(-)]|eukprot:XP_018287643.1 hypothetical protein PHYBLDRAFT_149389 [Phycomyces blakesleeanus NRRL 1555(-)]